MGGVWREPKSFFNVVVGLSLRVMGLEGRLSFFFLPLIVHDLVT